MRALTTTELNTISGGNQTEENTTVIVYQEPSVSTLFLYDLAFLVLDVALRIIIESSYEEEDYYYCDGAYCY